MAFACAEAYDYENYAVKRVKKMGSFLYIIKDIIQIFQRELRLIKPKKYGFSSENDKSETELLTITSSMLKKGPGAGSSKHITC